MYFCGGSTISPRFVLTAAHCVEGAMCVRLYFGLVYWKDDRVPDASVTGKNIIIHEDWDSETLNNDIALIELDKPINFTDCIGPIDLPRSCDKDKTYVGKKVCVVGFGYTSTFDTHVGPDLRSAELTVIDKKECVSGDEEKLIICAKGSLLNQKTSCSGDSGGPLTIKQEDRYNENIVGIVSFGFSFLNLITCYGPSAYTSVSAYLDWIEENTDIEIKDC